jgi:hypothetical protein
LYCSLFVVIRTWKVGEIFGWKRKLIDFERKSITVGIKYLFVKYLDIVNKLSKIKFRFIWKNNRFKIWFSGRSSYFTDFKGLVLVVWEVIWLPILWFRFGRGSGGLVDRGLSLLDHLVKNLFEFFYFYCLIDHYFYFGWFFGFLWRNRNSFFKLTECLFGFAFRILSISSS